MSNPVSKSVQIILGPVTGSRGVLLHGAAYRPTFEHNNGTKTFRYHRYFDRNYVAPILTEGPWRDLGYLDAANAVIDTAIKKNMLITGVTPDTGMSNIDYSKLMLIYTGWPPCVLGQ